METSVAESRSRMQTNRGGSASPIQHQRRSRDALVAIGIQRRHGLKSERPPRIHIRQRVASVERLLRRLDGEFTRNGRRESIGGAGAGRQVAPAAHHPGVLRRVDAPRLLASDARARCGPPTEFPRERWRDRRRDGASGHAAGARAWRCRARVTAAVGASSSKNKNATVVAATGAGERGDR